jgi:signal recognition particle receptor subunit beta
MAIQQNNHYKVVIAGLSGCGKSQYINRILGNPFEKRWITDIRNYIMNVNINNYNVEIVEQPGMMMIDRNHIYRGIDALIVLYDHRRNSMKYALASIEEAKEYNPDVRVIIVKSKCDVTSERPHGDIGMPTYNEYSRGNNTIPESFYASLPNDIIPPDIPRPNPIHVNPPNNPPNIPHPIHVIPRNPPRRALTERDPEVPPHFADLFYRLRPEDRECSICLQEISSNLFITKCYHYYHRDCLNQVRIRKCPMCNMQL